MWQLPPRLPPSLLLCLWRQPLESQFNFALITTSSFLPSLLPPSFLVRELYTVWPWSLGSISLKSMNPFLLKCVSAILSKVVFMLLSIIKPLSQSRIMESLIYFTAVSQKKKNYSNNFGGADLPFGRGGLNLGQTNASWSLSINASPEREKQEEVANAARHLPPTPVWHFHLNHSCSKGYCRARSPKVSW